MTAAKPMAMKDVIRFLIWTLTGWATKKTWGEITITVQDGQVVFVHEHKSYRDRLPDMDSQAVAEVKRELAAVS